MKKVKYYAPYWVSAIVVIALVLFLLYRFLPQRFVYTPFSKLPQLAAALENDHYFISEYGTVMKEVGGTQVSAVLARSEEHASVLVGSLEANALCDMLPHEYAALISERTIYICQDGRVFVARAGSSYKGDPANQICPPSRLPENAEKSQWEITAESPYTPFRRDVSAIKVTVPATDLQHAAVWSLSVKLKDGWYEIADGFHSSTTADADSNVYYILDVEFPALHEGDYRLEVNIGDEWYYQELTLTRKDIADYTLTY